jgi:hypothetical protein
MANDRRVRTRWCQRVLLIAACIGFSPAFAAELETAGATQCQTAGYLKDSNPRGSNVRRAPRANAAVIGHLPPRAPMAPGSDEIVGAEFDIIGAKDGWLLIRDARTGENGKQVFKGPGWIFGRLVDFTLGSNMLRVAPDSDAKAIAKLSGETKDGNRYGPDSYMVLAVHGCENHFVEVTIVLAPSIIPGGKPMRGWADKACSTQLTTCDPSFMPTPFDRSYGEADVRAACIDDLGDLLEGETCKVTEFGEAGTVEDHSFVYALYAFVTKDSVVVNARVAVFERRSDGQLRLRLAPDGDAGIFYKPAILHTRTGILLQIPRSESGTGNFNREALYIWRGGRWKHVDTESWLKTLQSRLPTGLGFWKGIYPDYAKLKAHTPLWRKGDGNACATGGTADIALAWSGEQIVLSGFKVHRPRTDCSE